MTSPSYLYTIKKDGCYPVDVHRNNGLYFGRCNGRILLGTEKDIEEWASEQKVVE